MAARLALTGVGGPIPEEHKIVQAIISEYAEALGFEQDAFMTFAWKLVQFSFSDLPIIAYLHNARCYSQD